jgi:hypothetical protein
VATLNDLREAVIHVLGLPSVPGLLQLNSDTRERAFECYVFALVLRAVQQAGGTVVLQGALSGPNPRPIVFRGGPGLLGSHAQNFCYASCSLNGREFEVHIDVLYLGSSGASHEIDVSLCDRSDADAVRQNPGRLPGTRGLRGAIECKFYDSHLGTVLGRAFVGLVHDLGGLVVMTFVTNGQSAPLAAYLSKSARPQPFFAVSPLIANNRDRLVGFVEQVLRQWARAT